MKIMHKQNQKNTLVTPTQKINLEKITVKIEKRMEQLQWETNKLKLKVVVVNRLLENIKKVSFLKMAGFSQYDIIKSVSFFVCPFKIILFSPNNSSMPALP